MARVRSTVQFRPDSARVAQLVERHTRNVKVKSSILFSGSKMDKEKIQKIILITGMAGSGKSTIIKTLLERGFSAIDIDDTGLCGWFNKKTGEREEYGDGKDYKWISEHKWLCSAKDLKGYIENNDQPGEILFLGGIVSNISDIIELCDLVIVLHLSEDVLRNRLNTRIDNHFAKSKDEQDIVIEKKSKFEEKCIRSGAVRIDSNGSIENTIGKILKLVNE